MSDAINRPTIRELVEGSADELRLKRNHGELHLWARRNGINTSSKFNEFKRCLLSIGVDYDGIRTRWSAAITRVERGEIRQLVGEHSGELRHMSFAQLNAWATTNAIEFSVEFGAFKSALYEIGVNYHALSRGANQVEERENIDQAKDDN